MQTLELNASTKAFLTATVLVPDPSKPGSEKFDAFMCALDGTRLATGAAPIPIYKDMYTGKVYAKVAEVMPSNPDATSQAAAKAIQDLNPVQYCSADGSVRGWFIEAPNFDVSAQAPAKG